MRKYSPMGLAALSACLFDAHLSLAAEPLMPHAEGGSDLFGTILLCCKIAGVLCTGIAAVVGIFGDTRTPGKENLSRAGKWLFAFALVGIVVAVAAELFDWKKQIADSVATRKQYETLAQKSDQTIEGINSQQKLSNDLLRNVEIASTRLESITADLTFEPDKDDPAFQSYFARLSQNLVELYGSGEMRSESNGLRFLSRNFNGGSIFTAGAGSAVLPTASKQDSNAGLFQQSVLPRAAIAIFVEPRQPSKFDSSSTSDKPFFSRRADAPDILLKLGGGELSLLGTDSPYSSLGNVNMALFQQSAMVTDSARWALSGRITSLKQLRHCQIVVFSLTDNDAEQKIWNASGLKRVTLFVNNQRLDISPMSREADEFKNTIYVGRIPDENADK